MGSTLLSRRGVLVLGGAAAAALAGYPVIRQVGSYPEPDEDYDWLTPMAVTVFAILGDFVVPPGGALPGSGGDPRTLRRIDALLGAMPASMRTLVLRLPLVFEHGTAARRYGARRLSALPEARRRDELQAWARADDLVRAQLFMALRSLLAMAYYERPDVLRAMGIAPGCGNPGKAP